MARGSTKKANLTVVGGHTPAGHNSGATAEELSDEQRQVLFLQNLKKVKAAKEAMGAASSSLRLAYKVAKSDGFAKKKIDYAIDLEKDDGKAMLEERRQEQEIAKWLGHPIGTQADLFDSGKPTDDRPLRDRAFDEGKRAGMLSEGPLKPPYDPGSDAYEGYVEGWHRGQEALVNIKKTKDPEPPLLRPEGNEPAGADAFDKAADGSEPPVSPPEGSNDDPDATPWPDDAQVNDRQPADVL